MSDRSIMSWGQSSNTGRPRETGDLAFDYFFNLTVGPPRVIAVTHRSPPMMKEVEEKPFTGVTLTFTGFHLLMLDWSLWMYREKVLGRKRRAIDKLRAAYESPESTDREVLKNRYLRHCEREKIILDLHKNLAYVVPRDTFYNMAHRMPSRFHGPLAVRALEEHHRPLGLLRPSPFDQPSTPPHPNSLNSLAELMKEWQVFSLILCDNTQDEETYKITIGTPPSKDSAAEAKTDNEKE